MLGRSRTAPSRPTILIPPSLASPQLPGSPYQPPHPFPPMRHGCGCSPASSRKLQVLKTSRFSRRRLHLHQTTRWEDFSLSILAAMTRSGSVSQPSKHTSLVRLLNQGSSGHLCPYTPQTPRWRASRTRFPTHSTVGGKPVLCLRC